MKWAPKQTGMSIYFLYGIRNSNEASKVMKDALSPSIQCHSEVLNGFVKFSSPHENSKCPDSPSHLKMMVETNEMNPLNNVTEDGKC